MVKKQPTPLASFGFVAPLDAENRHFVVKTMFYAEFRSVVDPPFSILPIAVRVRRWHRRAHEVGASRWNRCVVGARRTAPGEPAAGRRDRAQHRPQLPV